MLKKAISVLFVFVRCFSLTTAAFGDTSGTPYFEVKYTGFPGSVLLTETPQFTVTAAADNPDPSKLITLGTVTAGTASKTVPINVPQNYEKAGKYAYTITQSPGSIQGVTYDSTPIVFLVLVGYDDQDVLKVLDYGIDKPAGGQKKDSFTNSFSSGNLSITNTVSGNTADRTRPHNITVTLSLPDNGATVQNTITVQDGNGTTTTITPEQWSGGRTTSVTLNLRHSQSATISGIPAGVNYSVTQETVSGYTQNITADTGTISGGIANAVAVSNSSSITLATGIYLNNIAYWIILAIAVVGLVLLLTRKKRRRS